MICPNCTQEFDGPRCPNCGRPAVPKGNRVVAVILLVLLTLPLALFGACSALLLSSSSGLGSLGLFGVFTVVGLGGAYGTVVQAKKLWRGE